MTLQPKYRRLTLGELRELEPEFVQFLASQSITADDWQEMKSSRSDKVDGLIILFSDVVLDKILLKINLLEQRSHNEIKMYQFDGGKLNLMGFRISANSSIDLRNSSDDSDLIGLFKEGKGKAQLFRAEKNFQTTKQREAFALIQEGCLISKNERLFEALKNLVTPKQKSEFISLW